jgi:hypothetical protein
MLIMFKLGASKYDTEFEDKYVEGGVLYAHK